MKNETEEGSVTNNNEEVLMEPILKMETKNQISGLKKRKNKWIKI